MPYSSSAHAIAPVAEGSGRPPINGWSNPDGSKSLQTWRPAPSMASGAVAVQFGSGTSIRRDGHTSR